jgi:ParB family chromosome partitioning protein
VSNLLRLTQLAKPVQDHLMSGALEMGHARALLALPTAQQGGAAARVVSQTLSVRDTERLVGTLINPAQRAARRAASLHDADTARLENEVAEKLGAKVRIEPGSKGAGRLVISYNSLEELDGILARIR